MVELRIPMTVITNSLPVMELVAASTASDVVLIGVGGTLRRLTRSYVGPVAVQCIKAHFADRLFMSVKGITRDGVLTDADPLEAEVKRAMISRAEAPVLLADQTKFTSRGLSAIADADRIDGAVVHGLDDGEVAELRGYGLEVFEAGLISPGGLDQPESRSPDGSRLSRP